MLTATLLTLAAITGGTWSEEVVGLRARMTFASGLPKAGIPKLVPYLELRNVTNTIGTVDVYLDPAEHNLDLRLVDARGQAIEEAMQGVNGRNGFVARAMWLQIPYDSTVKMNVGLEGHFPPSSGSLVIETDSGLLWLPKGFKGEAYITGSFAVTDPPHEARSMRWEGVMSLPKVLVYAKGKPVTSWSD